MLARGQLLHILAELCVSKDCSNSLSQIHVLTYICSHAHAHALALSLSHVLSLTDLHWIGLNLSVQVEIKAQDAFDCRSETGGNSLQALAVLSLVRDTHQQMLVALARQDQICFFVGKVNGLSNKKRETTAQIDTERDQNGDGVHIESERQRQADETSHKGDQDFESRRLRKSDRR